ncbi:galanin peptides-like [Clupea harengus]|uniref:Galanin peptides-like n=1 Tax=Clupea harengus TaxID=7950 RepID=A0A6P8F231_CLUHA|nr:galanin peptides-like [Clupea harengus]
MQSGYTILCVSLLLTAQLVTSEGVELLTPAKRGWTLNSAGYLLGPYAHRTLMVRNGSPLGKRNLWEEVPTQPSHQPSYSTDSDDLYLQTLLDLIKYLRLKETGTMRDLDSPVLPEDSRA